MGMWGKARSFLRRVFRPYRVGYECGRRDAFNDAVAIAEEAARLSLVSGISMVAATDTLMTVLASFEVPARIVLRSHG